MTAAKTATLSEFLLARIAEDEAAARISYGVRWELMHWPNGSQVLVDRAEIRDDKLRVGHLGHVASVEHGHDAAHIARHDPARVLAESDAKRRIVELGRQVNYAGDYSQGQLDGWDDVLRLLALPYASHADYRDEWRP